MATAASLYLDWQFVVNLEHENFQLRQENRELHQEIIDLQQWKDKAIKQLASLAPLRVKAQQQLQHAQETNRQVGQMQRKIQRQLEKHQSVQALANKHDHMVQKCGILKKSHCLLQSKHVLQQKQHEKLQTMLEQMQQLFQRHLEKLVQLREAVVVQTNADPTRHDVDSLSTSCKNQTSPTSANDSPVDPNNKELDDDEAKQLVQAPKNTDDHDPSCDETRQVVFVGARAALKGEDEDIEEQDETLKYQQVLATFEQISLKSLAWLDQFVTKDFGHQLQAKIQLLQTQQDQLQHLHTQIHQLERQKDQLSNEKQTQLELCEQMHSQLEAHAQELERLQRDSTSQSQIASHLHQLFGVLLHHIHHFLKTVRFEIKSKFGFVPESIAQSAKWQQIVQLLDQIEQLLQLQTP